MLEQALAERPNECCGLLAGRVEAGVGRVVERFPLRNARADPRRYESDPHDHVRADRAMRERGLDLVAIYHSHPTSEPVPSRTDLEWNLYPGVMQMILSLVGPEPVLRAWWLGETDYREAEWECID
jgi:proteasome lid subunit RPN8/RPN11